MPQRPTIDTVPPELVELWRRFLANEIEAQDLADDAKALEKDQPVFDFIKP